jgi:hypothetical protein
MNFDSAYKVTGTVPLELLAAVNDNIQATLNDGDFNYQDRDIENKQLSWMRLDFMRPPADERLMPLYQSILAVINHITTNYSLDPLNSVSVSMLKPNQVLAEHTDGRFLHRITNRYLVPLMDSKKNYMYAYMNDEKVQWNIEYGKVYRINNAIVHSAINAEPLERFNLLIDTWEPRLKEKFKDHPDLLTSLVMLGVNYQFEKRLRIGPKVR